MHLPRPFLASLVAIPLGLFMALNPYVDAIVKLIFDIFKYGFIAWISIAIRWFGIDHTSKIFNIVIGTFIPCLPNSCNGIHVIDPELSEVVRMLEGKRLDEILKVSFPASVTPLFGGRRISLSRAWTCVLAADRASVRSQSEWTLCRLCQCD